MCVTKMHWIILFCTLLCSNIALSKANEAQRDEDDSLAEQSSSSLYNNSDNNIEIINRNSDSIINYNNNNQFNSDESVYEILYKAENNNRNLELENKRKNMQINDVSTETLIKNSSEQIKTGKNISTKVKKKKKGFKKKHKRQKNTMKHQQQEQQQQQLVQYDDRAGNNNTPETAEYSDINKNSSMKDYLNANIIMEMAVADVESRDDVNSQLLNQFVQQDNNFLQPEKLQLREEKTNANQVQRDLGKLNGTNKLRNGLNQKERKNRKLKKGSQLNDENVLFVKSHSPLSDFDDKNLNKSSEKRRKKVFIGDLSCMKNGFKPAPKVSKADIKYIRNDNYGIEKSFLEAEYHCHKGYKLIYKKSKKQTKIKNLICRNGKWIGKRPICKEIKAKIKKIPQQCEPNEAEKCEQLCVKKTNESEAFCACHKGFRLIDNRCYDINECQKYENICEYECINTVGGFDCKCPQGMRIGANNKCIDINECLLRNGHGPCQDVCINTWGSYRCRCDNLNGTRLANDLHSCEDIDECNDNNGGCSHICLNTMGQAFCMCPKGWTLDSDWKTCIDIDECQQQDALKPDERCNYDCINTPGSYKCIESYDVGADQPIYYDNNEEVVDFLKLQKVDEDKVKEIEDDGSYDIIEGGSVVSVCLNGYYFNETIGDCRDIDECEIDNGGCSDICINTNGSFYCSCKPGFELAEDDLHKCIEQKSSSTEEPQLSIITNIACPALFPPLHGYLECTRPTENASMSSLGRLRITNRPGSECVLRCPSGYKVVGKFTKTCNENGEWVGDENGTCIKYPTPRLTCEPNMIVEVSPKHTTVTMKTPAPKTDVNWDRDMYVEPTWAKTENLTLKIGIHNITFTAKHPISKLTISCSTVITVLVGEAPTVDFCPESQKFKIDKHHRDIKVSWIEPRFSDNVNVTEIRKTNLSGSYFGLGSHQIIYEAKDAAGYKSHCTFKIVVDAPKRRELQLPIKNNKFNYK